MFEGFKKAGKAVLLSAKNHYPELLIAAGVITSGAALVLACKATLDVQEPLKEAKENIESVRESKETNENYTKEITVAYANAAGIVVKHYILPVALEVTSLATIFASNGIQRKRNASLSASLAAVQTMFSKYRSNVTEKYGEEEDLNMLYGLHKEKVEVEVIDENGKTKKKKQEALVVPGNFNPLESPFARLFDPDSVYWSKSFMENKDFLKIEQSQLNRLLTIRGHMFLNDVFRELDLPQSDIGWDYGWIWDPEQVGQIKLNLYEVFDEDSELNGPYSLPKKKILIALNPEGYIRDKVFLSTKEIVSKFKDKDIVKITSF